MATANYITLEDLRRELQTALKPIETRLDKIETGLETLQGHVRDTQEDIKALRTHAGI